MDGGSYNDYQGLSDTSLRGTADGPYIKGIADRKNTLLTIVGALTAG